MTTKFITKFCVSKKKITCLSAIELEGLMQTKLHLIKGKNIYCKNMTKKTVYYLILMISAKFNMEPD